MFMIPSHPAYGGTSPQIAKGYVDDGETVKEAAWREGKEELGLHTDNIVGEIKQIWKGLLWSGDNDKDLPFTVFACEVESTEASKFDEPHFETGETMWMTPDEFSLAGHKRQRVITKELLKL